MSEVSRKQATVFAVVLVVFLVIMTVVVGFMWTQNAARNPSAPTEAPPTAVGSGEEPPVAGFEGVFEDDSLKVAHDWETVWTLDAGSRAENGHVGEGALVETIYHHENLHAGGALVKAALADGKFTKVGDRYVVHPARHVDGEECDGSPVFEFTEPERVGEGEGWMVTITSDVS